MQLTAEQQAVLVTNENLVINAVAGSGKTTTLIAYGNSGKRWSEAEEELLEELFHNGAPLKAIAQQLERGQSGVRIKLITLGLMDEGDE